MGLKIRFDRFDETNNEIKVVTRPIDYDRLTKHLDKATDELLKEEITYGECGVDNIGRSDEEYEPRFNYTYDVLRPYCKVQLARDLEQQREENMWLPSMVEFYWQNGIESKAVEFLKKGRFITSYRCAGKN